MRPMVRMPWEMPLSFDEGSGFTSTLTGVGGTEEPVDTLYFNDEVVGPEDDPEGAYDPIVTTFGATRTKTRTGTYITTPVPVDYTKVAAGTPNIELSRIWVSDTGVGQSHYIGEQNVFRTWGTEAQTSGDWLGDWVDGGEAEDGSSFAPGKSPEDDGGGFWDYGKAFAGGAWDMFGNMESLFNPGKAGASFGMGQTDNKLSGMFAGIGLIGILVLVMAMSGRDR